MREELVAFALTFLISSVMVSMPYILLELEGIQIRERVPAQRIAVELGALNTAFMLSRTLGSWASGGDTRLGSALLFLGTLGVALAPSLPFLGLARSLQGLGSGLVWPSVESRVARRGASAMAKYNIAMNLGFSFGSLFAGSATLSPSFPVLVVAPLALVPSFVKPEKVKHKGTESSRALRLLYLVAFTNGLAIGMRGPILMSYFLQYVNASPETLSAAWGAPGLLAMGVAYFISRKLDSFDTKKKLLASSISKALQSLTLALIAFTTNVIVIIILLALGRLGSSISVSASKAAQAEMSSGVRSFSKRQTFFSLGNAVGPFVGGIVYKLFATFGAANLSLLVLAGLGGLSSALYALARREVGEGPSRPS